MTVEQWMPAYLIVALCIWLAGCILGRKYKEDEWHVIGFVIGFGWPAVLLLVISALPMAFFEWANKVNLMGKKDI